MPKVNLDAFIRRANMEMPEDSETVKTERFKEIKTAELAIGKAFLMSVLRKPDFQRETNEWSAEQVSGLIQSFANGELIPSVILFQGKGSDIFVIDGSHRLSALAAWVNNDYGDGEFSHKFNPGISNEQRRFAEKTARIVNKTIGPYGLLAEAIMNQKSHSPEIVKRAGCLNYAISVQWLPTDDPHKAESAFLKINTQSVIINKTEMQLIQARTKPNARAARAIIHADSDDQRWESFHQNIRQEARILAKDINRLLFEPDYSLTIDTLDLPIGGKKYKTQTLPLVFDFVNIVNGINVRDAKRPQKLMRRKKKESAVEVSVEKELDDDTSGEETLAFLKHCKKIAQLVLSDHPGSLGLHPSIYFYSRTGVYKPSAFYAVTQLIIDLEGQDKFWQFTSVREKFESFLMNCDDLVDQIVRSKRSVSNGYLKIRDLYRFAVDEFISGTDETALSNKIKSHPDYKNLLWQPEIESTTNEDFSRTVKSFGAIRQLREGLIKCPACGGYILGRGWHGHHKQEKSQGGLGTGENIQMRHPYCDSAKFSKDKRL